LGIGWQLLGLLLFSGRAYTYSFFLWVGTYFILILFFIGHSNSGGNYSFLDQRKEGVGIGRVGEGWFSTFLALVG